MLKKRRYNMQRLASDQFPQTMRNLFDASIPDQPVLFSVLEGRNTGSACVDDKDDPSWAIVKAPWHGLFVGGQPPLDAVAQATEELLSGLVIWEGCEAYRHSVRPS